MAALSGDKLCSVTLSEQDLVQHLKMRMSASLHDVPESDQVLLLSNGRRLGAKRRLGSVLPRSRSSGYSSGVSADRSLLCRSRWSLGLAGKHDSVFALSGRILLLPRMHDRRL